MDLNWGWFVYKSNRHELVTEVINELHSLYSKMLRAMEVRVILLGQGTALFPDQVLEYHEAGWGGSFENSEFWVVEGYFKGKKGLVYINGLGVWLHV
jgi:hypothetical protein